MDAIIKQAVRDELRRGGSINDLESSTHLSNKTSRGQRTANRLSGLLARIRQSKGQTASKKRKLTCNHVTKNRIQIRWLNWKSEKNEFTPVRQKNGGGNRFLMYSDVEPLTFIDIIEKASSLFFPGGKKDFAGFLVNMTVSVYSATRTEITAFPGGGTLNDYLEENGMYPLLVLTYKT